MDFPIPLRRIVVTGSRDWRDKTHIWDVLQTEHDTAPFLLATGDCATGADKWAQDWAERELGWPVTVFYAPWGRLGRAAGPIRNKFIIDQFRPHRVLAFLRPESKGTVQCADYAQTQGIEVHRFFEGGGPDDLQWQTH